MNLIEEMDFLIFRAINGLAGQSQAADQIVNGIQGNPILKGMVPVLCMWVIWYRRAERQTRNRLFMISAVIVACIAIALGRGMAMMLPFRNRPIHGDGDLVNIPIGMSETILDGWSSFPSDHAVLYFSLATVIYMCSRKLGWFLYAHAILIVSLPRIYLGLHYPSDIVAGAATGILLAALTAGPIARNAAPALRFTEWEARHPSTFYPFMFFISFQIATMFDSLRQLARGLSLPWP